MSEAELNSPSRDIDFEQVVRDHHRRLIAYAYGLCGSPHQAEDLAQEAFIIAYRRLAEFDPARGAMGAWLRGIVRMKHLSALARRREYPLDGEILEAYEAQYRRWDDAESDEVLLQQLHDCIDQLDDQMRRAVELFYFKGLSGTAVARETRSQEATVRKRLQRSRAALQDCLEQNLKKGSG